MTGRILILIVLSPLLLLLSGCLPQSGSEAETASQPTHQQETETANLRIRDAVALANVHLKHEEFVEADRVLTDAIGSATAATNKAEAIALLAEVKAAARAKQAPAAIPVAAVTVPPTGTEPVESALPAVEPSQPPTADTPAPPLAAAPGPPNKREEVEEEVQVAEISGEPAEAPVDRRPASDGDVGRVLADVSGMRSPVEALNHLERFAKRHSFEGEWKSRFDQELAAWKERAEKGLVRNGGDWQEAAEYKKTIAEADALIEQAFQLIRVGNAQASVELLEKASSLDRNGIRADFVLGMIYTIVGPSALEKAEEHFQKVVRRQPNHISALNNLAITLVKRRDHDVALRHWRHAIELAPKTPAVSQNLGRLVSAASSRKLPMTPAMLRRFSTVYADLTASGKGQPADPQTGWLFMPLYLAEREQERHGGDNDARLVDIGSGSGFVVANGYVLTNRHVVRDEAFGDHDAYAIVAPGDTATEYSATLVAVSTDSDLAILHCPELDLQPVPFESEPATRGSEVLTLGYPQPGVIGVGLKLTQGIVTAVPEAANEGMLLFDATANPGNSGGPVCTRRGGVCAVLTAIYRTEQGYSAGVPSPTAIEFLRKAIKDWAPAPLPDEKLEWTEIDKRVGGSTVRILCRRQEVSVAIGGDQTSTDGCIEDRSCCICNGMAIVTCPRIGCMKGAIAVPKRVQTGFNPLAKQPTYGTRFVNEPCPTCSAKGKVDCPFCTGGIDPAVR